MERRHFLMTSAALAGGALKGMASPNDRIRIACVGVRGQGNAHIRSYARMENVEIAALCDVDDSVLAQRMGDLDKMGKPKPQTYTDFRKLLENKEIDAVSIATPNHHHTWMTIAALQAGKHVYCEKPCSHNMFESKQIVAATRKYNKLVQHGANSRSGVAIREAMQHMRDGLIGDVYMARGLCFKWRDTIGRKPVEPVPAGVNYDLWLGPAPKREFTRNRFHYNWHWFWDYGNGDLGNQGIHEVDIARWGLGVTYPKKVSAIGGHFMFDDDQETPNTLTATYEFDVNGKKRIMTFEVRHWMSNHEATIGEKAEFGAGNTVGNVFYGSKGYLAISGYDRYSTFLGRKAEPGPSKLAGGNNWQNFVDALRSGKREDLNGEIEEGAISCTLVHLANISYRLGRTMHFDEKTFSIVGDKEANAMFTRPYRKPFMVPEKV
ncbi:MAG: Gfo/Idh/MocA family oxidoreductase [Bryobacterales bacterium]|nr:Gfo/Idh/MocA family oxidoreductase [Bryobacterales bacterium]